jgi:PPM family protein phosphatase
MTRLRHAGLSDPGRKHFTNEDCWLADAALGLYAVADGMADPVAPQLAVDHLPEFTRAALGAPPDLAGVDAPDRVRGLVEQLNERVRKQGMELYGIFGGLGSTLVLALVQGRRALVAHLGDSRAYLLRAGTLEPLTRDHSQVTAMLDDGRLTPQEATSYRWNGGPTRFLGMTGKAVADVRAVELNAGDQLLLCSDGLPCMLTDEEIAAVLRDRLAPEDACRRLVDAANAAGGQDNVTVVIVAAA